MKKEIKGNTEISQLGDTTLHNSFDKLILINIFFISDVKFKGSVTKKLGIKWLQKL